MSRIGTTQLHDELNKKKALYSIRLTAYIKGSTKNSFLEDCIKREFNESKMAAHVVETYYTIVNSFPDLKEKEPNAIKKFIIDRIKL